LFSLSDIAASTVNDASFSLYLETAPTSDINVELWSCTDAFVEGQATWNKYSTGNDWTTTHGQMTFLDEVAFTSSSTTGQYYTWQSDLLNQYLGSRAAGGGIAYFILYSDTSDTSAIAFTSDDGTDGQRPKLAIDYDAVQNGTAPEVINVICETDDGNYSDRAPNLLTNGTFSTAGSGWRYSDLGEYTDAITFSGGFADIDGTQAALWLFQSPDITPGVSYGTTFTISDYTAGEITINLGVTELGTTRSAADTFSETITCGTTNNSFSLIANGAFDAKLSNIYLIEQIGPFYVTFSEPVVVTGTPQLTLETGAVDVVLDYLSGSGTAILTFESFPIIAGYATADLDATQLDLNGGTIVSADDATAVADTADILDVFPTGATAGSLAYNKAIVIDLTAPTAEAVNNTDASASGDDTYTVTNVVVKFAIDFDESNIDLITQPSYPRILMSLFPTDLYAYAMGTGDDTDIVIMGFDLTAGSRTSDLNFSGSLELGPEGQCLDSVGNPIDTSMGALDLSAVADIVIAVPDTWSLSATGDYADFDAFDTASHSVPADNFTCNFTGDLNTDAAGTSGYEIVFTGAVIGGIIIDEQYISLEGMTITGTLNVGAANTTIQRVIITP